MNAQRFNRLVQLIHATVPMKIEERMGPLWRAYLQGLRDDSPPPPYCTPAREWFEKGRADSAAEAELDESFKELG